jgi:class 3 adenylate cyclase/CHASE2 domain-containing sensor protein
LLWVFCFGRAVKWKATSIVPVLICAGVIAIVCLLEWMSDAYPRIHLLNRLEWITFDSRVRLAARNAPLIATNLGFAAMTDDSIEALVNRSLPYQFGLLWPRQVYARLVDELAAQGAKVVGFDVLFAELRPDHSPVEIDGALIPSDDFFAQALRRSSNVVLASEGSLYPPELFATNAFAIGHIEGPRERDGVWRRTHAFTHVRVWHPIIRRAAREFSWNLETSTVEPGKLLLPRRDGQGADTVPLNADGQFDVGRIERAIAEDNTRPVFSRFEQPFRKERLWQLGIVLAAHDLNLDLDNAVIDLSHGRIVLSGKNGAPAQRVIPVDRQGRFYIDWSLGLKDRRLTTVSIEDILQQYEARRAGRLDEIPDVWKGKLVVVGSVASGNNLRDSGATPLEQHTFLVSNYWNVANSLLMNRFIHRLELPWRLLIIVVLGALAGVCTWKLRTLGAICSVLGIGIIYMILSVWLFNTSRIWIPIVAPVAGSLLVTHVSLVTYLVRVERRERRHTKEIFSKIVSPDVVDELLRQEKLSLRGERRQLTVFFADVRGFTEITDEHQQRAGTVVMTRSLNSEKAKEIFDAEAADVLSAVNIYLGIAADCIKKHGGTLDKYIGDCVMAFWGAPIPNEKHAASCVHAVIDMQRAIFDLNQKRRDENNRLEEENFRRVLDGQSPLPLLDVLTFGSGINTGYVTVGLMGSEAHTMNYTIFGREVNLASRLESASGRGRILISEQTFRELQCQDPELAATCREQPPLELKGFRDPVKAYEVPWRPPELSSVDAGQSQTIIRNKNLREDCI